MSVIGTQRFAGNRTWRCAARHAGIADARLVVLGHCGHESAPEQRQPVAEALRGLFAGAT